MGGGYSVPPFAKIATPLCHTWKGHMLPRSISHDEKIAPHVQGQHASACPSLGRREALARVLLADFPVGWDPIRATVGNKSLDKMGLFGVIHLVSCDILSLPTHFWLGSGTSLSLNSKGVKVAGAHSTRRSSVFFKKFQWRVGIPWPRSSVKGLRGF